MTSQHAAICHGVKVPDSPFLTPQRIQRINAAQYEGQEISGALSVVAKGDKVLELGAGLGIVGAVVARNAKPGKVLSFEANPSLIEHIEKLYKANRLGNRIEVRNQVLVASPEAPEALPFFVRSSYLGSSLVQPEARKAKEISVPTSPYAQVKSEFDPDVMLIDIEGGELEFLRHASLDGIKAMVIEFHPEVYGRDGMRECKSILSRAGFKARKEHSSKRVWTCFRDEESAAPRPNGGWSTQIEALEGAVVVPPGQSEFVQRAGVLAADGAYCATGALWRNGRALTVPPDMPGEPLAQRSGTWLWGGVLWMHFGHFLVESLSRIWAAGQVSEPYDGILFIPKRPRFGETVAPYQLDVFEALAPGKAIACAAAPERVERLIVPGQGFGLGAMIRGTDPFRSHIATHFGASIPADGPEKLYISRSRLPERRGALVGEEALEQRLAEEGYTIYHPQAHSIPEQIAAYKAARQIIAAEGSALHLVAMVADADTCVAMIVRRPSGATRNIIEHLEGFAGRAPVVINELGRVWKPKGAAKPRDWMGELDFPAIQQALAAEGFISGGAGRWAPLGDAVVHQRLGDKYEEVPAD